MMRHSWSEPDREERRTTRVCRYCGLRKITRHEPGEFPWTEWYRADGARLVMSSGTPACERAEADAA